MMKHLPAKSFRLIEGLLLYSKEKVSYTGDIDRKLNNSNTPAGITTDKINDRIAKFADVINKEKVYRITLRHFCDLEKINYLVKMNFKITCSFETEMKKFLN